MGISARPVFTLTFRTGPTLAMRRTQVRVCPPTHAKPAPTRHKSPPRLSTVASGAETRRIRTQLLSVPLAGNPTSTEAHR